MFHGSNPIISWNKTLYICTLLIHSLSIYSNKCSPVLHNAEGYVREIIQGVAEKKLHQNF